MTGSLVWFRSDLRVADNPALDAAFRASPGRVAALFVATPQQWQRHGWGPPKTDFGSRSIASLGSALAERGIALRLETCPTFADVPEMVLRAARQSGSHTVLVNSELEVNERRRDEKVEELLAASSMGWRAHHDQTIVPPDALRTRSGNAYTVFTPFFRAWVDHLERHGIPESLPAPAPEQAAGVEVPGEPNLTEGSSLDALRELWPAGEREARRRLRDFLAGPASDYHEARNDPTRRSTSALSPYLAVGAISARTALWSAIAANEGRFPGGDQGIAAWLRQLAWRDFYRHVLVAFPRVSMDRPFLLETERVAWREDPAAFEAWRAGRTGFPIVDAGMRALAATGWLHNRLRMIVASFLAKDLLIDWREGERHFANSLVDADLANNNGGWQWAASTGTDAAPYFRIFNPWRQSQRFDPDGRFIRRHVPELAHVPSRALHDPERLAAAIGSADYPPPIVDHAVARRRALAAFRGI
jgi:deoxyribodipyrimidine photo-lyase